MVKFNSFSGVVIEINNIKSHYGISAGCNKFMSVKDNSGNIVNFVVSPNTYFTDHKVVSVGDFVSGYYDVNTPVILIYPPQYSALIVVKYDPEQNVKVDFFNSQLISSDGTLKLDISSDTQIMLKNGQPFTENLKNRNLVVFYRSKTNSIPALAAPDKIIVWC